MRDTSPHELSVLFEQAVDLAEVERDRLFDSSSLDPARRTTLRHLLAAYDSGSDAIREALRRSFTASAPQKTAEAAVLPAGSMLSHFRIEDVIGRGGFGVVYRARDTRLDRPVALKCIRRDLSSDPSLRPRFLQEARAASALDHPNIAVVYDVGEERGTLFIAMAHYSGRTLRRKMGKKPMDPREAVAIARQAAVGLVHSHDQGIIHRDIKPENLFLTVGGVLKILDFGLAKVTNVSLSHGLTQQAERLGTCAYMSPEQVRGDPVDARTDLWSLGVVLFEMLAGRLPFQADYDLAVFYNILYEAPPRLRMIDSSISEPLDDIVATCLLPVEEGRFATAAELLAHLERMGDGADRLPAPPPALKAGSRHGGAPSPAASLPVRTASRRRAALTRIPLRRSAAVLTALLATLIMVLWTTPMRDLLQGAAPPDSGPLHLAVLPIDNLSGDPAAQAFADGFVYALASKLAGIEQFGNRLSVVSARDVVASGVETAAAARSAFGVNLVISGSVRKVNDEVRLTLDLVDAETERILRPLVLADETRDLLDLQSAIALDVVQQLDLEINPSERRTLAENVTTVSEAYDLYVKGVGYLQRYDEEENVEAAVDLFERAIEMDPGFALAHAGLGEAYWQTFSSRFEPRWSDMALRQARHAADLDGRYAQVWITLALIYRGTGDYPAAERALQRATAIEPRNGQALLSLASLYELQRKMDLAEQTYRDAVTLRPGSWHVNNEVGRFYLDRQRYGEAAAYFQRVIELRPDSPWGYNNLALTLRLRGRTDEAVAELRRAVTVNPNAAGPTALALRNLADIHIVRRDLPAAVRELEQALDLAPRDRDVWFDLARATTIHGDDATEAWRESVLLHENVLSVNPEDALVAAKHAVSLAALGRLEEARRAMRDLAARDPQNMFVLQYMAEAYILLGDGDASSAFLRAALARGLPLEAISTSPWLTPQEAETRPPA